jgi:hypothetical protein
MQLAMLTKAGFLLVKFQRQGTVLQITTSSSPLNRLVKIPVSNGKRQTLVRQEQVLSLMGLPTAANMNDASHPAAQFCEGLTHWWVF